MFKKIDFKLFKLYNINSHGTTLMILSPEVLNAGDVSHLKFVLLKVMSKVKVYVTSCLDLQESTCSFETALSPVVTTSNSPVTSLRYLNVTLPVLSTTPLHWKMAA